MGGTEAKRYTKRASELRRVLVLSTSYKPGAQEVARELIGLLERRGIPWSADLDGTRDISEWVGEAELVVAVGGDGTILTTARRLATCRASIPTLGVNIGKLGFLAEFSKREFERYIEEDRPIDMRVVPRMMLCCEVETEGRFVRRYALNDAVVAQGIRPRLISIDLAVDGQHATQYHADGVICSTPVGSTAYSLSLGGPILTPGLEAFVITPVAPHSLTNRPVVIEATAELRFTLRSASEEVALVVDGQEAVRIDEESVIRIWRAARDFLLISHKSLSYYSILRRKLDWGRDPRGD